MYRRSCVVLEAKGEKDRQPHSTSVLCWRVSSIKQMFVGLVVCFFSRVLCRTSLEAMGQAGSPSKWAASFYSTRDLAGEYSCLHYIFSLERKTTYRNLQRGDIFPCDFFCFFFLTSPISIVFFLPCSVKESFVRELQSLRFLRE